MPGTHLPCARSTGGGCWRRVRGDSKASALGSGSAGTDSPYGALPCRIGGDAARGVHTAGVAVFRPVCFDSGVIPGRFGLRGPRHDIARWPLSCTDW